MKKFIYISIIIICMITTCLSINKQFKEETENAYKITILGKVNRKSALEDMTKKNELGLVNIEYYDGMTIYINDNMYNFFGLDKNIIYNNGFGENRINIPIIERVNVKPWSKVEENKRLTTDQTYVLGQKKNIIQLSEELSSFGIESSITKVNYENKWLSITSYTLVLFFILYVILMFVSINRNQKRILLYKLNGKTLYEYIIEDKDSTTQICLSSLVISILFSFSFMIIMHNMKFSTVLLGILLSTLYVLTCGTLYYTIIGFLMKAKNPVTFIKGESFIGRTSELLKGILFTTKLALFILLVFSALSLTSIISSLPELNQWNKVKDYSVSYNVTPVKYTTREKQEEDYNENDDFKERELFVKYMETNFKGAYAFPLSEYTPNYDNEEPTNNMVVANKNYLILDNFVDENVDTSRPTLFIPQKYKQHEKTIKKKFNSYYEEIALNDLAYTLNYNVKYYKDKDLFAYKYTQKGNKEAYYQDPIIYMPGIEAKEYNIFVYAYQKLMYYDNQDDQVVPLESYYKSYDYNNYKEYDLETQSKFAQFSSQFYLKVKVLASTLVFVLLGAVMNIIIYLEVIKSYIKLNRVIFLNKKLLGKTSKEIYRSLYREELIYCLITFSIGLVVLIVLNLFNEASIALLLACVLIYMVAITCFQILYLLILNKMIFKIENQEIYRIIKGEL